MLIDPYCNNKVLPYLKYKNKDIDVLICNGPRSKVDKEELIRFKKQYGPVTLKTIDNLHDRFLIIDDVECYDLGTSLNFAGNKIFVLAKIENQSIINEITKIGEQK